MAIPNPQRARYNSWQEFLAKTKGRDNAPSFTNLFSVKFGTPRMMRSVSASGMGPYQPSRLEISSSNDLDWLLDYYADSVNLPSKQVTTSQTPYVGAPFKYATNTAYSQISINFIERWTTMMASDSEQYTRYYDDYVCPEMWIYKWERGGGDLAVTDPAIIRSIRESGTMDLLLARKYQLTAAWQLQNLYPYNIGSVQLNNQNAQTMTLSVGFYYERYRFFTQDQFDTDTINYLTLPANSDNNTDSSTSSNQSVLQTVVNSILNMTGFGT